MFCTSCKHIDASQLFFWRDKQKHEIDFILKATRGGDVAAIECKSQLSKFDPAAMQSFRGLHPKGANYVVCLDAPRKMSRRYRELEVTVIPYEEAGVWLDDLTRPPHAITRSRRGKTKRRT